MITLSIPEMSCGHCKTAVENAVARLDSKAVIRVDLPARRVEIETDQPPSSLIAALLAAGFAAEPV